jgi:hypothetical protein
VIGGGISSTFHVSALGLLVFAARSSFTMCAFHFLTIRAAIVFAMSMLAQKWSEGQTHEARQFDEDVHGRT